MLNTFYRLFISATKPLEVIFGNKFYLVLVMGLGLGVGMGLTIHQYPVQTFASPETETIFVDRRLEVTRVRIPEIGIDTVVEKNKNSWLSGFNLDMPARQVAGATGIGRGLPVVIQGVNRDFSLQNLSQAKLGHEVYVLASNGGWYRYTVVETRYISAEQLDAVMSVEREEIILYTLDLLQKQATVVIAVPLR